MSFKMRTHRHFSLFNLVSLSPRASRPPLLLCQGLGISLTHHRQSPNDTSPETLQIDITLQGDGTITRSKAQRLSNAVLFIIQQARTLLPLMSQPPSILTCVAETQAREPIT